MFALTLIMFLKIDMMTRMLIRMIINDDYDGDGDGDDKDVDDDGMTSIITRMLIFPIFMNMIMILMMMMMMMMTRMVTFPMLGLTTSSASASFIRRSVTTAKIFIMCNICIIMIYYDICFVSYARAC